MEEIVHNFGLSYAKIIAQVLIFVIVYIILKKKAFGPIQAMLEKRRERIAEGEANLEKIRADLATAEAKSSEIIASANAEADRMIAEAKESAQVAGDKKRQEAVAEAGQIVVKAREAARLERETMLAEMKRDFGRLVIDTTSRVTGKVLDDKDQKRINEETAAQISL